MATAYSSKSQARAVPRNFLEALRELGDDFKTEAKVQVTRMATQDLPESLGLAKTPSSGTLNPSESFSMDQLQKAEMSGQQKAESAFNARLHQMRDEERASLMRQEAAVKEQVKSLQEEIRMLAKSAGEFSQEVEMATFQATVNPGAYHKSFFAHLKLMVITLRKKVSSSRQWLAEHNSRAKKKGHYWGQVQKSGTKYMLSSERYMVTSTG